MPHQKPLHRVGRAPVCHAPQHSQRTGRDSLECKAIVSVRLPVRFRSILNQAIFDVDILHVLGHDRSSSRGSKVKVVGLIGQSQGL